MFDQISSLSSPVVPLVFEDLASGADASAGLQGLGSAPRRTFPTAVRSSIARQKLCQDNVTPLQRRRPPK